MSVAHWDTDPDLWDKVLLDGVELPGIAKVDVKSSRKLDQRSASGSNGARLVDKGQAASPVVIDLQLWTEEHLKKWQQVHPSLSFRQERLPRVTAGTKQQKAIPSADRAGLRRERRAVSISHPQTEIAGIRLVYVTDIQIGRLSQQILPVTITCLETHQERMTTSVTRAPQASPGRFGRTGTAFRAPSEGDTGPTP